VEIAGMLLRTDASVANLARKGKQSRTINRQLVENFVETLPLLHYV
jgi:hypothetical protein